MKHRTELIRRTSRALGTNYRYTSAVVREFIDQMGEFLEENGFLSLDDFGRFAVEVVETRRPVRMQLKLGGESVTREVEVDHYVRVHFSKSRKLKRLLDQYLEDNMDKYGVDTTTGKDDAQLEKQASEGCPECGKELQKHGSVLICPVHGSAPFEAQKHERR